MNFCDKKGSDRVAGGIGDRERCIAGGAEGEVREVQRRDHGARSARQRSARNGRQHDQKQPSRRDAHYATQGGNDNDR